MVLGKCRLCLSRKADCLPIFEHQIYGKSCVPISVKIAVCISVPINQEDLFPQLICRKCNALVDQFYTFREKCLSNYLHLLNNPASNATSSREMEEDELAVSTNDDPVAAGNDEPGVLALDENVNGLVSLASPDVDDTYATRDKQDPTTYDEVDDSNLSTTNIQSNNEEHVGYEIIGEQINYQDETSRDLNSEMSNQEYEETIEAHYSSGSASDAGEEFVTLTVEHQQDGETDSFKYVDIKSEGHYGSECETYINLIRLKEKPLTSKMSSRYKSCKICHEIFLSAIDLSVHEKTCFHEQEALADVDGEIVEYSEEELDDDVNEEMPEDEADNVKVEMADAEPSVESGDVTGENGTGDTTKDETEATKDETEARKDETEATQTFLIDTTQSLLLESNRSPLAKRVKERQSHFCRVCSKFFKTSASLKNHVRIHSGDKPFVCSLCSKAFTQLGSLRLHERAHNQDYSHVCTDCGKGFFRPSDLEKHVRTHTGTRPFQCSFCNKCFHQMSGLVVHERIHTGVRPHSCPICQMSFNQLSNKYRHMKTHAGGSKPFNCVVCHRKYASRADLEMHQTAAHYGGKPRICAVCGKAYRKEYQLRDHVLKAHSNEQNFVCELCNKAFFKSQDLKNHLLIHTGERPLFPCTVCGQRFTLSGNLRRHQKLHKEYTSSVEATPSVDDNIMYVDSMEMEVLDILQFDVAE